MPSEQKRYLTSETDFDELMAAFGAWVNGVAVPGGNGISLWTQLFHAWQNDEIAFVGDKPGGVEPFDDDDAALREKALDKAICYLRGMVQTSGQVYTFSTPGEVVATAATFLGFLKSGVSEVQGSDPDTAAEV